MSRPLPTRRPPQPPRPAPWREAPPAALAALAGLMTDIDDTLTRDGLVEPVAREALHALADAGLPVIAITGRSLGFSERFARELPLAAVVAENGAVALLRDGGALVTEYAQPAAERARNTQRLQAALARVQREVPGATPARDSAGRVTDIAIDHAEFATLDEAAIERVCALLRGEGLTVTVSSIHVNAWFGSHDKVSGARWMLRRLFGRELDDEGERWLYVGDSTNDQAMFARFALSVGVANLRRFADRLHTWPAWITDGERGAGFADVARRVLAARGR